MAMIVRAAGICIVAILLIWGRPLVALAQAPGTPTAPTTISQCDQLIQVANRATDAAQQLSQNPSSDSVRDLLATANIADRAIGEMQALNLTDGELLKFRDQFVTMYEGVSRAIRDLVAAANQQDQAASEQAFTALQTATAAEEKLVPAINRYCERTAQRLGF